ncbi:hypothetical protein HDZ31DRAFT_43434 [Schizophyllum fasciatum]
MSATADSPYCAEEIKVDDLCFDDGNIIITAEDSRFRVHRSILSARSSFFASLFALPPHRDNPTWEGLPVIELPDKAFEVAHFLRAIFDSGSFEGPSTNVAVQPTKARTRQIAAILRLAHKYDVPYLRRRALTHAAAIYPRSFEGARYIPGIPASVHFILADVATEVGADWLLLVALECCTRMGPQAVANGWPQRKAKLPPLQLPPSVQERCLLAVRAQDQQANQRILAMFLAPNLSCSTPAACMLERNANATALLGKSMVFVHHFGREQWSALLTSLCRSCYAQAELADRLWGAKYWEDMPARFGLPPWSELDSRRKQDIGS